MNVRPSLYKRHRFAPEIIQYLVWLYHRFNLSSRDIEDIMVERGIEVSYEAIRLWCIKFGPKYASRLRRCHQGYGDTFFKRLLRANGGETRRIVTDKLRTCGVLLPCCRRCFS